MTRQVSLHSPGHSLIICAGITPYNKGSGKADMHQKRHQTFGGIPWRSKCGVCAKFQKQLDDGVDYSLDSVLHWSILGLGAFLYSYPTELLRILSIAKLVFLVSKRGGVF